MADILREEVSRRGRITLRVAGKSMAPLLRPGDRVTVEAVRNRLALFPGQIVVVAAEGPAVIHHFLYWTLREGYPHLRTMGRSGQALDRLWPADSLIGRVVHRERGNRPLTGPIVPFWLGLSLMVPMRRLLATRVEKLLK